MVPKVYACIGRPAQLSCSFEAKPLPQLEWGKMMVTDEPVDTTDSSVPEARNKTGFDETLLLFTEDKLGEVKDATDAPKTPMFVPLEVTNNLEKQTEMEKLLLNVCDF